MIQKPLQIGGANALPRSPALSYASFGRAIPKFLIRFNNASTLDAYRRYLIRFLDWSRENQIDPLRTGPSEVEAYLTSLKEELLPASVQVHLTVLRCFARHLQRSRLTNVNWWHAHEFPLSETRHRTLPIALSEMPALYDSAALLGSRTLLMLRLLYECGLRRNDLVRLRATDLVSNAGGYELHLERPGRAACNIAIPYELGLAFEREAAKQPDSIWLFPGYKGRSISLRQVNRIIHEIGPKLHPHQFRVTHMRHALELGLRSRDIAYTLQCSPLTVLAREHRAAVHRTPTATDISRRSGRLRNA